VNNTVDWHKPQLHTNGTRTGVASQNGTGPGLELVTTMPSAVKPLPIVLDDEMQQRPKPKQIVADMLLEKSTSAIVGPPGTGKGLVAIDLAYRMGCGMDYHGHAIEPGAVVYIAMERQGGIGARIRAWKAYHQWTGRPANVAFVPVRFSLFELTGAARLLETIATVSDQMPVPVRFVIIDTFAKAYLPGDENSTRDMGIFMGNLQRVAETGPNLQSIHHTNAGNVRERGNTAFRGDVDTLMMLDNKDGGLVLSCDKQNEMEAFDPIGLRIVPSADSALVVTAAAVTDVMLTRTQLEILKSLRNAALDRDASTTEWFKAYGGAERTFYDHRSRLIAKGYVKPSDGKRPRYALTLAGNSAVTADCGVTADVLRPQSDMQVLRNCGGVSSTPASAVQSRIAGVQS
jgi:hypothetical protein